MNCNCMGTSTAAPLASWLLRPPAFANVALSLRYAGADFRNICFMRAVEALELQFLEREFVDFDHALQNSILLSDPASCRNVDIQRTNTVLCVAVGAGHKYEGS